MVRIDLIIATLLASSGIARIRHTQPLLARGRSSASSGAALMRTAPPQHLSLAAASKGLASSR